jgi:beta-barrel assembly-enhancing protease
MKKIIPEFIVLLGLFFGTWFLLNRVDFMKRFKIKERIDVNEKKLGDALWNAYSKNVTIINNRQLTDSVERLKELLCIKSAIDPGSIQLYIVANEEVNAFAMPNSRLVLYTGLIKNCSNAEELCGVMSHEIAHIQKDHVMKKLAKEAGVTILSTIADGPAAGKVVRQLIEYITSTAYDRSLETEADMTGIRYLCNAGIDPGNLAAFFLRISKETSLPEMLNWISTHPDSKDRAEAIMEKQKTMNCDVHPLMTDKGWELLKTKSYSSSGE